MKNLMKLLTNESFLGVISLTIIGSLSVWKGNLEITTGCVAGVAALLRGQKGEK